MIYINKHKSRKFNLAIHSTINYFGFAYKETHNENAIEKIFIKEFNRNISNNLIIDLKKFLENKSIESINRISISNGPANFNASRLIVSCARILSHQINCSLDSYSCFQLMAKRIAIKNNIFKRNKTFWISSKLKKRGYIAGKYNIYSHQNDISDLRVKELSIPKLYQDSSFDNTQLQVDYNIKEDLNELLELSFISDKHSLFNSWENTLPIYPMSPTN